MLLSCSAWFLRRRTSSGQLYTHNLRRLGARASSCSCSYPTSWATNWHHWPQQSCRQVTHIWFKAVGDIPNFGAVRLKAFTATSWVEVRQHWGNGLLSCWNILMRFPRNKPMHNRHATARPFQWPQFEAMMVHESPLKIFSLSEKIRDSLRLFLQALVNHCAKQNQPEIVEAAVMHMDLASLDLNQVGISRRETLLRNSVSWNKISSLLLHNDHVALYPVQ